jgi:uncharacterized protein
MPCEDCHGRCCKRFIVYITAFDAARIVKAIPHLEPTSFLNPYPAIIDSKYPAFKLKGEDSILGLDSKDGSMKDCKFLVNVGHTKICGIYENRPFPCRTYPFYLKDGKLNSVEEFICQKQWWPESEERDDYIQNINQSNMESKKYEKIVEIWNMNSSQEGNFADFINFILKQVQEKQEKDPLPRGTTLGSLIKMRGGKI